MVVLLLKTIVIWLVLVITAILNAGIREKLLVPMLGYDIALPASGVLLSILIFLVSFVSMPFIASSESKTYIFIGVAWFTTTLLFEFLFGYFVSGRTWHEMMQVFNISEGDLFVVALLITLISPWLSAKLRRMI